MNGSVLDGVMPVSSEITLIWLGTSTAHRPLRRV